MGMGSDINRNIREWMERYQVTGLSMARIQEGHIRMTEGYGILEAGTDRRVTSHSMFNACSISKFVTSMLVLKLADQGIVDIDEDVNVKLSSWKVPESECTQHHKVTLRTLLSHQSGILDPENSFGVWNSVQGSPSVVELLEGRSAYCREAINVTYEPGSEFAYSDTGFCIIQQVIEDVSGKPFQVLLDELIFAPLHIRNSKMNPSSYKSMNGQLSCGHHKNGRLVEGKYPMYPYPAASGLWTTPADLAVLVIELMNSLKSKSILGISEGKAKEWITPQGGRDWTGLGVFLDGSEQEVEISSLGWGVGFQCLLTAKPYQGKGSIIMTNIDSGVHQSKGIIGEILRSLE
ncbi:MULTISPECIES: serine hydrolase domain-containing protein [Paenibacillus]|jgi:CubicO group peptidase (beta-lactamase class C family)|nr:MULTISPECIES: serine hydrolase domain-containing protein [Paenibacillus]